MKKPVPTYDVYEPRPRRFGSPSLRKKAHMSDEHDIVAKADALDARINLDSGAVVRSLVSGLARQKQLSKWMAVSILLDVMLTLGLGFYAFRSQQQGNQIDHNTAVTKSSASSLQNNCQISNDFRKRDRELWNEVLSLPPSPGLTPLQLRARLESNVLIKHYLDVTFALLDCKTAK